MGEVIIGFLLYDVFSSFVMVLHFSPIILEISPKDTVGLFCLIMIRWSLQNWSQGESFLFLFLIFILETSTQISIRSFLETPNLLSISATNLSMFFSIAF
eukprot:Pompholyxophrys_sp_v1_NODE_2_length_20472_cov_5.132586.p20 type:complete len:100 gc:universal NODE_2_length_20472_cov_5.132586:5075-4776(-)